jgi:hypothetical protein
MNRSPLQRKTPLARSHQGLRKTPLRKRSRRQNAVEAKNKLWRQRVHHEWKSCAFSHKKNCWGDLEAHHIFYVSQHRELRHEPINGILCCQHHHQWIHNYPKEGLAACLVLIGKYRASRLQELASQKR